MTRGREGRTTPGVEAAARLVGLDAGVELLSSCLEAASIPRWLQGVKVHLDNIRPIDLLRQGRLSPVIAAIEAMKSHSFA